MRSALSALDALVKSCEAPAPPALLQLPVPQSRSQGGAPAGGEAARYGELHGDGPKERSRGRQEDSSHSPWQSDEEHWPPTAIRAQCRAPPREQQDEAPLSRPLQLAHKLQALEEQQAIMRLTAANSWVESCEAPAPSYPPLHLASIPSPSPPHMSLVGAGAGCEAAPYDARRAPEQAPGPTAAASGAVACSEAATAAEQQDHSPHAARRRSGILGAIGAVALSPIRVFKFAGLRGQRDGTPAGSSAAASEAAAAHRDREQGKDEEMEALDVQRIEDARKSAGEQEDETNEMRAHWEALKQELVRQQEHVSGTADRNIARQLEELAMLADAVEQQRGNVSLELQTHFRDERHDVFLKQESMRMEKRLRQVKQSTEELNMARQLEELVMLQGAVRRKEEDEEPYYWEETKAVEQQRENVSPELQAKLEDECHVLARQLEELVMLQGAVRRKEEDEEPYYLEETKAVEQQREHVSPELQTRPEDERHVLARQLEELVMLQGAVRRKKEDVEPYHWEETKAVEQQREHVSPELQTRPEDERHGLMHERVRMQENLWQVKQSTKEMDRNIARQEEELMMLRGDVRRKEEEEEYNLQQVHQLCDVVSGKGGARQAALPEQNVALLHEVRGKDHKIALVQSSVNESKDVRTSVQGHDVNNRLKFSGDQTKVEESRKKIRDELRLQVLTVQQMANESKDLCTVVQEQDVMEHRFDEYQRQAENGRNNQLDDSERSKVGKFPSEFLQIVQQLSREQAEQKQAESAECRSQLEQPRAAAQTQGNLEPNITQQHLLSDIVELEHPCFAHKPLGVPGGAQSNLRGSCSKCGRGVYGHQLRRKDPHDGTYLHADPQDCAQAPQSCAQAPSRRSDEENRLESEVLALKKAVADLEAQLRRRQESLDSLTDESQKAMAKQVQVALYAINRKDQERNEIKKELSEAGQVIEELKNQVQKKTAGEEKKHKAIEELQSMMHGEAQLEKQGPTEM